MLVEDGKEDSLTSYLDSEQMKIVCWMDNDQALSEIENRLGKATFGK